MGAGSFLRIALDFAGRHGPLMLLGGVFIGLAAPQLAAAARPLLGVAVFVFTLGAFLKVDWPAFKAELAKPWQVGTIVAWLTFGVPLSAFALVSAWAPEGELATAVILAYTAPPVGAAAAIAAMMGLSAPLALLATLAATVVAPFTLPALATAFTGTRMSVDAGAMLLRLLLIVGGACLTATLLRRFAGGFVAANPHAMTGIAVAGLILVAVGAMHGMDGKIAANPAQVGSFLLLAFVINPAFQVIGAALFCWTGWRRALTVGFASGNRSVTLIWAALGPDLLAHPDVELYLAMSVFPIFVLPALTRPVIGWLLRERPLDRAGAPHPARQV